MRKLVTGLTRLTWVTAGYGWTTLVVPIIVAAPMYFTGKLSFGGMMLAVGAFNQVMSSLRWFVENFSVIADWRAEFCSASQVSAGRSRRRKFCIGDKTASPSPRANPAP